MYFVRSKDSPTTIFVAYTTFSILTTAPSSSPRATGLRNARERARRLVEDLGITRPDDIDIYRFLARYRSDVCEGTLDGADAQLVSFDETILIRVSQAVVDPRQRAFDLAHELGHLLLEHPSSAAHERGVSDLPVSLGDGVRDFEAEASAFAEELLMPYDLMLTFFEDAVVSADLVQRVATTFSVSALTASTRLIEITDAPCMVVLSEAGHVKWSKKTVTFPYDCGDGSKLGAGTLASEYFARGVLETSELAVEPSSWFQDANDIVLTEHAIVAEDGQSVLSLLRLPVWWWIYAG